jgi:hypothetical protein
MVAARNTRAYIRRRVKRYRHPAAQELRESEATNGRQCPQMNRPQKLSAMRRMAVRGTLRLGLDSAPGLNNYPYAQFGYRVGVLPLPAPNWSQPLPRPIIIPEVMQLATLDDVRVLFDKHLPAEYRAKFGWRQLAALLRRAAQGREDAAEVGAALQLILKIERVPYHVV